MARHIRIIADIEGNSGCWSRRGATFLNQVWAQACEGMSADVAAAAIALLNDGVEGQHHKIRRVAADMRARYHALLRGSVSNAISLACAGGHMPSAIFVRPWNKYRCGARGPDAKCFAGRDAMLGPP